jgi:hypothetical protein
VDSVRGDALARRAPASRSGVGAIAARLRKTSRGLARVHLDAEIRSLRGTAGIVAADDVQIRARML